MTDVTFDGNLYSRVEAMDDTLAKSGRLSSFFGKLIAFSLLAVAAQSWGVMAAEPDVQRTAVQEDDGLFWAPPFYCTTSKNSFGLCGLYHHSRVVDEQGTHTGTFDFSPLHVALLSGTGTEGSSGALFLSPLGLYSNLHDADGSVIDSMILPAGIYGDLKVQADETHAFEGHWLVPFGISYKVHEYGRDYTGLWTPLYDSFCAPDAYRFGVLGHLLYGHSVRREARCAYSYNCAILGQFSHSTSAYRDQRENAPEDGVAMAEYFRMFPLFPGAPHSFIQCGAKGLGAPDSGSLIEWSYGWDGELNSFCLAPLWQWSSSGTCLTLLGGKNVHERTSVTNYWYTPLLRISSGAKSRGVGIPGFSYDVDADFERDHDRVLSGRLPDEIVVKTVEKKRSGTNIVDRSYSAPRFHSVRTSRLWLDLISYETRVDGGLMGKTRVSYPEHATNTPALPPSRYALSKRSMFKVPLLVKTEDASKTRFDGKTRECRTKAQEWSRNIALRTLFWSGKETKRGEKFEQDEGKFSLGWCLNYARDGVKDTWRFSILGDVLSLERRGDGTHGAHFLLLPIW